MNMCEITDLLPPPNPKELKLLQSLGATTWGEYVVDVASANGISPREAFNIFEALGTEEAFDGFVSACRDDA